MRRMKKNVNKYIDLFLNRGKQSLDFGCSTNEKFVLVLKGRVVTRELLWKTLVY